MLFLLFLLIIKVFHIILQYFGELHTHTTSTPKPTPVSRTAAAGGKGISKGTVI
jgi:hypothetical protein